MAGPYSVGPIRFTGVSSTTLTRGPNDPELGTTVEQDGRKFVYVYNTASNVAIGHAVTPAAGGGAYSCTVSTTTSADLLLGVAHVALASGAYGFVVSKGYAAVEMGADYSAAAGALLAIGADGVFDIVSNTTGNKAPAVAKILSAAASGASAGAFLNIY